MAIKISSHNSRYLKISTDNSRDYSILREFPGLLPYKLEFLVPKVKPVVQNIISRLKALKLQGEMEEEVYHFMEEKVDEIILPPSFRFLTKPLLPQKVAFEFCLSLNNVGLLLEQGLGKTKVVLDVFAARECKKALIVCPKALMFVWEQETKTHRWDKSVYLITSTNVNEEVLEGISKADIVVVNYRKAVILKNELKRIPFDFMAVDEALIKSHDSQQTESVTEIGKNIPYKILMSGTLVNNTVLDIFAPLRFLEPALVGTSFTKFRNRYCYVVKEKVPEGSDRKPKMFVGSYRNLKEARSILDSISIVMTKKEWLKELPGKVFVPMYIPMSDSQRQIYQDLASNYISELNQACRSTPVEGVEEEPQYIEADSALTLLCKLTQVSNGFVYKNSSSEDELGDSKRLSFKKRETYYIKENSKLDRLETMFSEELKNKKLVLWYNMNAEQCLIEHLLSNLGIPFRTINGGTKNISDVIRLFNSDPECKVLLCQAKAVNYGVTILGKIRASDEEDSSTFIPDISSLVYTHVFFSLNFSLEVFLQQQDRSHRIGQTHEVTYYILLANNPTDLGIWECLEEKKLLRNQVLVDIVHRAIDYKKS